MRFVKDPALSIKIQKMQDRVRWQSPSIMERGIDQTRMEIVDPQESPDFSFLVIGDTGAGPHPGHHPQRRIAEQMLEHRGDARFILHTGDVIYLVGSSEFYAPNFIEPYREFLVGGEQFHRIAFDQMVFNLPFLPVPGNHDYYDLPLLYGALIQATYPLRRLVKSKVQFSLGWHGSYQGKAYAQAFLDPLWILEHKGLLNLHLDQHYTAQTSTGRCLKYEPGLFTRLPNRYYSFRYGGVDFFGLDSNTFNEPIPLPADRDGRECRQMLESRRTELERQKQQFLQQAAGLNPQVREQAERIDDLRARVQQLEEIQIDIDKQLDPSLKAVTDTQQLEWLRDRLIDSWNTPDVRGRVLFFHHPPYVTEATKYHQAQTLAVRLHLRQVLDEVAGAMGEVPSGRGIVDLVLNGHAHCLEYLRTVETGHADSNINWLVCGGSGHSLRRQRVEGPEVTEILPGQDEQLVAKSEWFVGRAGQGSFRRRPYSFLRIDVQAGDPVKFEIRPYVSEWLMGKWSDRALPAFVI